MDLSLYSAAALALEGAINAALAYDPGTRQRLRQWQGKSLLLRVQKPDINIGVRLLTEGLTIAFYPNTEAESLQRESDALISGSASDMLTLAQSQAKTLAGSGVLARGDLNFLEDLMAIARDIDIDWADALNHAFGDHAGSVLAQPIKKLGSLRTFAGTSKSTLERYIKDELHLIPHHNEFLQQQTALREVRSDVARLEAKVAQLKMAITGLSTDRGTPNVG